MEVGKKYYIIAGNMVFLGEVIGGVSPLTPMTVKLTGAIRVGESSRSLTALLRMGLNEDTVYDLLPDGITLTATAAMPWHHHIPNSKVTAGE